MLLAYIAGELSPEERDRFEHRLFEDEVFSEQIEEAEFELMEDSSEGTLPPEQRAAVEAWIADSPELSRSIAITEALRRPRVKEVPQRLRFLGLWWTAAAAACLVALAVSLTIHHRAAPSAPQVARAPQPPEVRATAPPVVHTDAPFVGDTILLRAERLRGSRPLVAPPRFTLHQDRPTRLQILVNPPAAAGGYALELTSGGGTLHVSDLRATMHGPIAYIDVALPHTLTPGRYRAILHSANGSYPLEFEVAGGEPHAP